VSSRAPTLVVVVVVLVAGGTAGCGGGGAERAQAPPPRFDATALTRVLEEARGGLPGAVSGAIVRGGRVRWSGGSGVTDRRARRPVSGRTVFAIGSVTKTFVAALALRLAERGVLDLDDPVTRWLPAAEVPRGVTLRRMLDHTSGLSGIDENPGYARAIDRPAARHRRWTPQQTLRYARRPDFPPGEGWHYSDTGYVLAGLAIERATGTTVARALREHVLAPLDLGHAGLQPQNRPPADAAHGHGDPQGTGITRDLSGGMRWLPYDSLASSEWTSGGMFATAEDVARFADALLTGDVVDRDAVEQLTRWHDAAFVSYIGYGLGVGRRFARALGGELWGSLGRVPGFHADVWHAPASGTTVAVLAGDERIDTTEVADALLRAALPRR
jgi:D-alanyl-D-alanine carboxypeptidase